MTFIGGAGGCVMTAVAIFFGGWDPFGFPARYHLTQMVPPCISISFLFLQLALPLVEKDVSSIISINIGKTTGGTSI
jgi:hypothetical protein